MQHFKENKALLILTTILLIALVFFFHLGSNNQGWALQASTSQKAFIHPNNDNCQSCHMVEWQEWHNSHHQKAMQVANDQTVLGDFDDVEISINNENVKFYKRNDEYWVNLENKEYKIDYTFGFEPLQQYLIKTQNGKYQTLPYSWDSRPKGRGGQKWFHIYGDDRIPEMIACIGSNPCKTGTACAPIVIQQDLNVIMM